MIELENGSGETPAMSEEAWADLDRKTLLRLDLLLVPIVAMLYLLSFLDRANIGNARVVCPPPLLVGTKLIILLGRTSSRLGHHRSSISDRYVFNNEASIRVFITNIIF